MTRPLVVVASTAFDSPHRTRCLGSVARQVGVLCEHIYVDASTQSPPLEGTHNLWLIHQNFAGLPDDAIIAHVDGDDWLLHRHALARVVEEYERYPETLVTYGQYMTADGKIGHSAPYGADEDLRRSAWRASHLRTWRAGLYRRIDPLDLQHEGAWLKYAADLAVMFPLIEMAGRDRVRFIPDVLYVYNHEASFERNATQALLDDERALVRAVRNKRPYQRLDSIPEGWR